MQKAYFSHFNHNVVESQIDIVKTKINLAFIFMGFSFIFCLSSGYYFLIDRNPPAFVFFSIGISLIGSFTSAIFSIIYAIRNLSIFKN